MKFLIIVFLCTINIFSQYKICDSLPKPTDYAEGFAYVDFLIPNHIKQISIYGELDGSRTLSKQRYYVAQTGQFFSNLDSGRILDSYYWADSLFGKEFFVDVQGPTTLRISASWIIKWGKVCVTYINKPTSVKYNIRNKTIKKLYHYNLIGKITRR